MISVFGGNGFVGSHWLRQTAHKTYEVPRKHIAPQSQESLYFISTTDNYNVTDYPLLDIKTNLLRLMRTLSYVQPGHTFNFISSWFVYGEGSWLEHPAKETDHCDPRGFYSITKRTAEQLLISYCKTHGISWRIFRLANCYGLGDRPSAKKNALQWLISEMAQDKPVSLYWDGNCYRNFIHVTDAAAAIEHCLTAAPKNSITNIGSPQPTHFGSAVREAHALLSSQSIITATEPTAFHRQIQVRDFHMDTARLTTLGFTPKVSIQEGLKDLCDYYRLIFPRSRASEWTTSSMQDQPGTQKRLRLDAGP